MQLEPVDHRQHRDQREHRAAAGRAGPAADRGTRAAAAGRRRAAAPSPARRAGRPSPTRSAASSDPAQQRPDRAAHREAGDPDADRRPCAGRGSRNMLRISDSVDGARVAPAMPSSARVAISIPALVENAASTDATPNAAAPISSRRRRPIRSPRVPIVISEPGDQEPVDVDDPEQLRAAGPQVRADGRHRQVQHRQVHRVEQAGQRDHGEPDPFAPRCSRCGHGRAPCASV